MKLQFQIFKTMEKIEFYVLIKHYFLVGKKLFNQSNDLISVIRTLHRWSKWLRGGSHLPSIKKTIQVRRTKCAGHSWRSRDELISDVLLWIPTYARGKARRPSQTYVQQLCEDTGCSPEDLPEAMNDREKWRERVRDIRACGTTRWWWCWWCWL